MQFVLAKEQDWNEIYRALENNFCAEERRDYNDFIKELRGGQYRVWHILDGTDRVGFFGLWEFLQFTYVEHFVVYPEFRNKGVGGRAIHELCRRSVPIVLETEPPTGELQCRRIEFYKRNGFVDNQRQYLQPPYRVGDEAIPLLLFSSPEKLRDWDETVKEIYQTVYHKEYV